MNSTREDTVNIEKKKLRLNASSALFQPTATYGTQFLKQEQPLKENNTRYNDQKQKLKEQSRDFLPAQPNSSNQNNFPQNPQENKKKSKPHSEKAKKFKDEEFPDLVVQDPNLLVEDPNNLAADRQYIKAKKTKKSKIKNEWKNLKSISDRGIIVNLKPPKLKKAAEVDQNMKLDNGEQPPKLNKKVNI